MPATPLEFRKKTTLGLARGNSHWSKLDCEK